MRTRYCLGCARHRFDVGPGPFCPECARTVIEPEPRRARRRAKLVRTVTGKVERA